MRSFIPRSAFEAPKYDENTFVPKCGNCGSKEFCAHYCYSCANRVCNFCNVEEEGCCMGCLHTFPKSPHSTCNGSPASIQMPLSSYQVVPSAAATAAAAASCQSPWVLGTVPASASENAFHMPLVTTPKNTGDRSDASTCSGTESNSEAPTTMMITNIPCRYGQEAIEEAIESVGFGGSYDLIYIPKRKSTHDGNLGYAFVNFLCAEDAERFVAAFQGYQFPGSRSVKKCVVKVAHQQGYEAIMNAQQRNAENRVARMEQMAAGLYGGSSTDVYC